ncbi:MAG: sugar isomerase domain-containing protein [Oligoflexia bacterium]|nr:sugar isomerase domain-containing protein [Oligoflexia bacterium]
MTDVKSYAAAAIPHLSDAIERNSAVMERLASRLVADVKAGRSLLVFGSGHSAIFPLELYHRAGGASFVIPIVADYLMPQAGPPVVRVLERTPGVANMLLARARPMAGEMLWLSSQSGINAAVVDLALEAKKQGLVPVAFTSVAHSSAVKSRHPSGRRLFEVCDEVVDFGGRVGDAVVSVSRDVVAGPLSTLTSVLLGHSIVVAASGRLEAQGIRCVYTSVNTPEGEARNRSLEERARERDVLLS